MPTTCCKGPGFPTPKDAATKGERERLLYVVCVRKSEGGDEATPDYIATVDVDPQSSTYCKVIHRVMMPNADDELHHTGWNACSSCFEDSSQARRFLVCPAVNTSRVNILDVNTDPRAPTLYKVVGPEVLESVDRTNPHTVHCLGSKQVMLSTMGDKKGNGKGGFVLLDNENFELDGVWEAEGETTPFGYDFWYQPRHNVMISTEWGAMTYALKGFNPEHVANGFYGSSLHVWDWEKRTKVKTIDLGTTDGMMPLEIRFFHEPTRAEAFVGCALSGTVFYIYKDQEGEWRADKVISVGALSVEGWALPQMPAVISDILISMDDRFLFFSCWMLGELRQYDVSDPLHPKLVGKVRIGGIPSCSPGLKVLDEGVEPYEETVVNGKKIVGAPQMIQLSLDGKRMYVSTSLISAWDNQFYPGLSKKGGDILQVSVNTEEGGLRLDPSFHVDLSGEPGGPSVAHEMRYPGGDCSSDIWL